MSTAITPFYDVFTDRSGKPLDNGSIWIGVANLDPQSNPIGVYWDEALSIPAAQPIKTLNGYPIRLGTPAKIYCNSTNYSLRVTDKIGAIVYNVLSAIEKLSPYGDFFYQNFSTITYNCFIDNGKNAMSAGPITILDGVVVTVPAGSVWTIV